MACLQSNKRVHRAGVIVRAKRQRRQGDPELPLLPVLYEQKYTNGLADGLIALVNIPRCTPVLAEQPLLALCSNKHEDAYEVFRWLSDKQQGEYLELPSNSGDEACALKRLAAADNNAHVFQEYGLRLAVSSISISNAVPILDGHSLAVYKTLTRIRVGHFANAVCVWDGATGAAAVLAMAAIEKGEELRLAAAGCDCCCLAVPEHTFDDTFW